MKDVSDLLAEARALFEPCPNTIYLDAATYGLPPRPTVAAMQRAVREWQEGTADWVRSWDQAGEGCREDFARLIGASADSIALIPSASVGVGTLAASLRAHDEVLVPDDEFASLLFPLLVAARERGTRVRTAPLAELAEHITASTTLVAFSLIQSQSGSAAPLEDTLRAARSVGARTLIDATHAVPFVPVAADLDSVDYLVCSAYKHLLCPRGVAFMYVARQHWEAIPPVLANWRSASNPYQNYYGGPLDLAPTAARFDVSLAWFSWAAGRESLRLLVDWQRGGLLGEVVHLARQLAARLGLPEPRGSVVSVPVEDAEAVRAELSGAGIQAAVRAGSVRLSPHVYNTSGDVDRAVEAIARFLRVPAAR